MTTPTAPTTAWSLSCGDVLPGCPSVLTGATAEAVLAEVGAHAATAHGVSEVDETTAAAVRSALRPPA